jgi:hypothetical protein
MAHSRKTRVFRGLAAAAMVAITLLMPLFAPPKHRINVASFCSIQLGMTEEEVETIFGVPAGQYYPVKIANGLASRVGDSSKNMISSGLPLITGDQVEWKHWTSNGGSFNVGFRNGRVVCAIGWRNGTWETWRDAWRRLFS